MASPPADTAGFRPHFGRTQSAPTLRSRPWPALLCHSPLSPLWSAPNFNAQYEVGCFKAPSQLNLAPQANCPGLPAFSTPFLNLASLHLPLHALCSAPLRLALGDLHRLPYLSGVLTLNSKPASQHLRPSAPCFSGGRIPPLNVAAQHLRPSAPSCSSSARTPASSATSRRPRPPAPRSSGGQTSESSSCSTASTGARPRGGSCCGGGSAGPRVTGSGAAATGSSAAVLLATRSCVGPPSPPLRWPCCRASA
mmetsp:Transcript_77981/g.228604  ORF Transcript_77981/g.228604 Transcript_77981/m.228604 type:complete len:252 (-) Transcript_77981:568-1323(-)